MKVCPVCKSRCFDDMDKCYGCLHDFTKATKHDSITQKIPVVNVEEVFNYDENNNYFIPEYFELDTFPYIEEDDFTTPRGAHVKDSIKDIVQKNFKITIELPQSVLEKYIVI